MAVTQKSFKIDKSGRWPRVIPEKPEEITLGFEWEVTYSGLEPESEALCDRLDYFGTNCDHYSLNFVDMYSFHLHGECDGSEFASPVFSDLGQAKKIAKKLIRRTSKDPYLDVYDAGYCGIHVHANHPSLNRYHAFVQIWGMLNRADASEFVLAFSGRELGEQDYYDQGVSDCWDTDSEITDFDDLEDHIRLVEAEMLKVNGVGTIEFRLWASIPEKLIPAIEFTHACTKFILTVGPREIPHLTDFKSWLWSQRGYETLKKQPEWSLIK